MSPSVSNIQVPKPDNDDVSKPVSAPSSWHFLWVSSMTCLCVTGNQLSNRAVFQIFYPQLLRCGWFYWLMIGKMKYFSWSRSADWYRQMDLGFVDSEWMIAGVHKMQQAGIINEGEAGMLPRLQLSTKTSLILQLSWSSSALVPIFYWLAQTKLIIRHRGIHSEVWACD